MMSVLSKVKKPLRIAVDTRIWRPSNLVLVSSSWYDNQKNTRAGFSDQDHLLAATQWLKKAQDATPDGGIVGRYSLKSGWTSSYPETTGYIIPTFLSLEKIIGEVEYKDRARKCVDFLLSVQLDVGAFPGMEIAENRTVPSVFNTAQIVSGLRAWHSETQEQRALDAVMHACDWLVAQQDNDGVWRKYIYGDTTYTYMAHAACWLGEVGSYLNHQPYLEAAQRHLDWVLSHVDSETGWFDKCGFSQQDHIERRAVTHTIAYTIWGVLLLSRILKHDSGLHAARTAAYQIARRLELSRWLPGMLNWQWRPQANYACLTGNAQMALIWFELDRLQSDPILISAACKAIDFVKRAQPMFAKDPGIRGGIPGSDPVWGDYIYAQIPNWSAKYFIDALLEKQNALARLHLSRSGGTILPPSIPLSLPSTKRCQPYSPHSLRTILYTSPDSDRVQKLITAWSSWGFTPTAVVISHQPDPNVFKRILCTLQKDGVHELFKTLLRKLALRSQQQGNRINRNLEHGDTHQMNVVNLCGQLGVSIINVGSLDSESAVKSVQNLHPDLAISAGSGILRQNIIAVPRLGTLNSHMGILPPYRGMNVAEWARMAGDVVGCTVHLIDEGIDTGDILCCRAVNVDCVENIMELRNAVDQEQIQLLGEVVQYIYATGQLPPRRQQQPSEGRQYFVMHPVLRTWLDVSLKQCLANS